MNICAVCSANICRSPFIEHILIKKLPSHNIYSAGILGLVGCPAYEGCVNLASSYKIDLSKHSSKGFDENLVKDTDIFLVVARYHKNHLIQKFNVKDHKIKHLGDFLPDIKIFDSEIFGPIKKGDDIPDPMGLSDKVKPILDIMEIATLNFIDYLLKERLILKK